MRHYAPPSFSLKRFGPMRPWQVQQTIRLAHFGFSMRGAYTRLRLRMAKKYEDGELSAECVPVMLDDRTSQALQRLTLRTRRLAERLCLRTRTGEEMGALNADEIFLPFFGNLVERGDVRISTSTRADPGRARSRARHELGIRLFLRGSQASHWAMRFYSIRCWAAPFVQAAGTLRPTSLARSMRVEAAFRLWVRAISPPMFRAIAWFTCSTPWLDFL
jgi:hypothetical protein